MNLVEWARLAPIKTKTYIDALLELVNIEVRSGASQIIALADEALDSQSAGRGICAVNSLKCLHWSRRFEYPWVLEHANVQPNDRVLDVGAGNAPMQYALARRCKNMVTVDTEPTCGDDNARILGLSINSFVGDARTLPFKHSTNIFDKVVCVSVVEHIEDAGGRDKAIDEMWRVLAPGGTLVLTLDIASPTTALFPCDLAEARRLLARWDLALPPFPDDVLTAKPEEAGIRVLCVKVEKPL